MNRSLTFDISALPRYVSKKKLEIATQRWQKLCETLYNAPLAWEHCHLHSLLAPLACGAERGETAVFVGYTTLASPCTVSSQAFLVNAFRWRIRDERNLLGPRDWKRIDRTQ